MIDDPLYLIVAFAAGLVLGAFYLGTLWLVLQRLHRARHPGIWIMGSAACRVGLLLTAWYWISGGKLDGLIACLLAFTGVLPWLHVNVTFGSDELVWFGQALQIGVTVLLLLLTVFLPSARRVLERALRPNRSCSTIALTIFLPVNCCAPR